MEISNHLNLARKCTQLFPSGGTNLPNKGKDNQVNIWTLNINCINIVFIWTLNKITTLNLSGVFVLVCFFMVCFSPVSNIRQPFSFIKLSTNPLLYFLSSIKQQTKKSSSWSMKKIQQLQANCFRENSDLFIFWTLYCARRFNFTHQSILCNCNHKIKTEISERFLKPCSHFVMSGLKLLLLC